MFKLLAVCMKDHKDRRSELITTMVGFSEKARREGLLVLEEDGKQLEEDFARKGIQLVVDDTDPELVKDILETDLDPRGGLCTGACLDAGGTGGGLALWQGVGGVAAVAACSSWRGRTNQAVPAVARSPTCVSLGGTPSSLMTCTSTGARRRAPSATTWRALSELVLGRAGSVRGDRSRPLRRRRRGSLGPRRFWRAGRVRRARVWCPTASGAL